MSDLRGVYEVVGFRFVEYTSQSDGQKRTGYDVCLRRCEDLPGQVGVPDESVWLGSRASFKPELGVMVRKSYNRWGKVEDLILV